MGCMSRGLSEIMVWRTGGSDEAVCNGIKEGVTKVVNNRHGPTRQWMRIKMTGCTLIG